MNRRIERREIDQVGLEKVARFMRRLGRESLLGQVSERFLRAGMKDAALDRTEETALKNDAANFNLSGLAGSVASEDRLLAVI